MNGGMMTGPPESRTIVPLPPTRSGNAGTGFFCAQIRPINSNTMRITTTKPSPPLGP